MHHRRRQSMTGACFSPLSPSKSSSKSSSASSSSASSSLMLSALSSLSAAPAAPATPAAPGGGGVTVGSEMMSMLMHWSIITASNRGEPVMIVSRAPPVRLLLLRTGTSTFTSARIPVPMPAWQLCWLCWLSIATSRCPSSSSVTPSCSNAATTSSTLPSYRSSNVGRGSCGSWDKGAPAGEGGGGGGKAAALLLFVLLLLVPNKPAKNDGLAAMLAPGAGAHRCATARRTTGETTPAPAPLFPAPREVSDASRAAKRGVRPSIAWRFLSPVRLHIFSTNASRRATSASISLVAALVALVALALVLLVLLVLLLVSPTPTPSAASCTRPSRTQLRMSAACPATIRNAPKPCHRFAATPSSAA